MANRGILSLDDATPPGDQTARLLCGESHQPLRNAGEPQDGHGRGEHREQTERGSGPRRRRRFRRSTRDFPRLDATVQEQVRIPTRSFGEKCEQSGFLAGRVHSSKRRLRVCFQQGEPRDA
jgi:hypothetical protein